MTGLHCRGSWTSIRSWTAICVPAFQRVGPERNWEHPWLNPRRLLRSERPPERFEELYEATLRDIDETRTKRRNSVIQSFEFLWSPALEQLNVAGNVRTSALNDLIDAHILYRCLTSSLDRAPQLATVRSDIESVRNKLRQAFEKLQALSSFKELEAAEEAFSTERGVGTQRTRKRIDDALLSRLFEIRSRDTLNRSLEQIDSLLESVWGRDVELRRGHPRKYSKDFLILRCARIYERYCPGSRASARRYREHPDIEPKNYDRGAFYKFLVTAFSTVDVSFEETDFGFEKDVLKMLRVRKKAPDADLLVKRTSTPDDLVAFARLSESKSKSTTFTGDSRPA